MSKISVQLEPIIDATSLQTQINNANATIGGTVAIDASSVEKALTTGASKLQSSIQTSAEASSSKWQALLSKAIENPFVKSAQILGTSIQKSMDTTSRMLSNSLKTPLTSFPSTLKSAVSSGGVVLSNGIKNSLTTAGKGLVSGVTTAGKGIGEGVAAGAKTLLMGLGPMQILGQLMGPILSRMGQQMETTGKLLQPVFDKIVKSLTPILETVVRVLSPVLEVFSKILEKLSPLIQKLAEPFVKLVESLMPLVLTALDLLMPLIETFANAITTLVGAVAGGLGKVFSFFSSDENKEILKTEQDITQEQIYQKKVSEDQAKLDAQANADAEKQKQLQAEILAKKKEAAEAAKAQRQENANLIKEYHIQLLDAFTTEETLAKAQQELNDNIRQFGRIGGLNKFKQEVGDISKAIDNFADKVKNNNITSEDLVDFSNLSILLNNLDEIPNHLVKKFQKTSKQIIPILKERIEATNWLIELDINTKNAEQKLFDFQTTRKDLDTLRKDLSNFEKEQKELKLNISPVLDKEQYDKEFADLQRKINVTKLQVEIKVQPTEDLEEIFNNITNHLNIAKEELDNQIEKDEKLAKDLEDIWKQNAKAIADSMLNIYKLNFVEIEKINKANADAFSKHKVDVAKETDSIIEQLKNRKISYTEYYEKLDELENRDWGYQEVPVTMDFSGVEQQFTSVLDSTKQRLIEDNASIGEAYESTIGLQLSVSALGAVDVFTKLKEAGVGTAKSVGLAFLAMCESIADSIYVNLVQSVITSVQPFPVMLLALAGISAVYLGIKATISSMLASSKAKLAGMYEGGIIQKSKNQLGIDSELIRAHVGEAVIPADVVMKNRPTIDALINRQNITLSNEATEHYLLKQIHLLEEQNRVVHKHYAYEVNKPKVRTYATI